MSAIIASTVGVKTMEGLRFGSLLVLDRAGTSESRKALWRCQCDCGEITVKQGVQLRYGSVKSCGCKQLTGMREARFKNGAKRSDDVELRRFYAAWSGMKARCRNKKNKAYRYYGEIGIDVCERWNLFENFKADMWPRPSGMTLDRINPHLGYSPENCRWATNVEQRANRRIK